MPFGSGPFATSPFATGPRRSGAGGGAGQFLVRIGSTDVTRYMRADAWSVQQELNGRDTCTVPLVVADGYVPHRGERITALFGNVRLWAGIVHDIDLSYTVLKRNDYVDIVVRGVDLSALADRITVNEVYQNKTAGEIIRHIIGKYLAADGITDGGVHDGPTLQKVVFSRKPASDCLKELCRLTGYHWFIDQFGVLQFFPKFASLAPFEIDQTTAVFRDARVSKSLSDFRNVQFAIGGQGITLPITEFFEGDDIARTFTTAYPLAQLLGVTVNGAAQTYGIRSVDDAGSKQWFWNANQQGINQDPSQPILKAKTATTPADRLAITYTGFYGPVTTKLVNAPGIAARQAVEGGSGRYEVVDQDASLDGLEVTVAKARGDLRRFGTLDDVIQFETDRVGLAIGQTVVVDLPALDVQGASMLITAMETSLFGIEQRRHRVTATSGELKGTYQEFFAAFFSRGVPITISPDDIINEVAVANDLASASDLVTVTSGAAHSGEWGADDWGTMEWG